HETLQSGARVTSPASRRVLEKCAFQWTGVRLTRVSAIHSAAPVDRFRLDRGLWLSLKAWGRVRAWRDGTSSRWRMIFSENQCPPRTKSWAGFSGSCSKAQPPVGLETAVRAWRPKLARNAPADLTAAPDPSVPSPE